MPGRPAHPRREPTRRGEKRSAHPWNLPHPADTLFGPDATSCPFPRPAIVTDTEDLKRRAAARALEEVRSGMVLGLGSGSTVAHFLDLLGAAVSRGSLGDVVGVPSSVHTARESERVGIPLTTLTQHPSLDLTVDGADEVTPALDLIKGMGGALLREKIVAQASRRLVIIGDEGKAVTRLGTVSPLPVEVVAWEWQGHVDFLADRGARVTVRVSDDGAPFKSDNGNLILDCRFPGGIDDPRTLDDELHHRAGVVETGLFLGLAAEAILAGADGVRVIRRNP
jgi:ribose 5-phosphate isomerase A